MQRPVIKILEEVLDMMDSFTYENNEDRPSNSFFEAELNEDSFFILKDEIKKFIEGAKNTEQLLQPDNGYVCNRPGSCAKGQRGKCYSGFDCPDKAIAG